MSTEPVDQPRCGRWAIPAPVYGAPWRKKPRCYVCRRRFPTVADYREHYLKEHR